MEAQNPLSSSQLYPYFHQFLLDQKGCLPAGLNSQEVFADVFSLCLKVVTDGTPGENLTSRYVDDLQQRIGNRRQTELTLCLLWVVLTVQEHPSYPASTFTQRLKPLIKHSLYFNKARQLAVNIRQHERHIQTDFLVTLKACQDMKVKLDGDSGTVNNCTENTCKAAPVFSRKKAKELVDIEVVREEILTWVSRVRPLLDDAWKADFPQIWEDILNMQEVKEKVYAPGKQKNTNFNQYLIGNILFFMFEDCGAWNENDDYNASAVCMRLIGTTDHQLRKELAKYPSEEIKNRLHAYFTKKFQLES